jgi:hypothetical protein
MSRRALILGLVLVVVLAGVGAWLLTRGDETDAERLRAQPGVERVIEDRGDLLVVLAADVTPAQAAAVLAARPATTGVRVVLQRATLRLRGGQSGAQAGAQAAVLVAAGRLGRQARTIDLIPDGTGGDLDVEVRTGAALRAAAVVRQLLAQTAVGGRPSPVLDRVEASLPGAPSAQETIRIEPDAQPVRELLAPLDAGASLGDRLRRLVVDRTGVTVWVTAPDADGVRAAWGAARTAFGRSAATRLSVIVPAHDDVPETYPLDGTADEEAGPAIALLRALAPVGRATVRADLSYAQVTVADIGVAARAARITQAAAPGVDALRVDWRTGDGDDPKDGGGWIQDTPARVPRLVPGIVAANRGGLGVGWAGNDGRPASLRLDGPRSILQAKALDAQPARLRGALRQVRAIDWPGEARFGVSLGRGDCDDLPGVPAEAALVSTSAGRASSVTALGQCTPERSLAAIRRAWDATATR